MIVTWSDSNSSYSDDEEEQVENLCFMANDGLIQDDETEYESSNEVNYSDFHEYSNDELSRALVKCIQCEQNYLSKIKLLKRTIRNLTFEKECLEKSKI